MDNIEPNQLPVVEPLAAACRHLRNKGMYVYTDGQGDDAEDDFDASVYWCFNTMKSFGPDDESVGGRECRNPSRSCYEAI
jgi:hypothetical protein